MLIELFSLGVMAEMLQVKKDKRNISVKSIHLTSILQRRRRQMIIDCFTLLCLCLMQNYAAFRH